MPSKWTGMPKAKKTPKAEAAKPKADKPKAKAKKEAR